MFAQNLKYLRKKRDMEQIDLAYKLGRKSASSISEWEKGKYTPKLGVLSDIAKIFNVTISDLMEKDLSKQPDEAHAPRFSVVPVFNQGNTEEAVDYVNVSESIVKTDNEYIGIIIADDSMDREFHDGDIIIVEKNATISNKKIGVFKDSLGIISVRSVKYLSDTVLLMPESHNEAYEPSVYRLGDNMNVVGRVVAMVRKY